MKEVRGVAKQMLGNLGRGNSHRPRPECVPPVTVLEEKHISQ